MSVGVVTIVRDRTAHLLNVLRGLAAQTIRPDEVIVVVMGGEDPAGRLPELDPPVTFVHLDPPDGTLPLGAARNTGAVRAASEHLVFLDVDCIPGRELVARYDAALSAEDGIFMGDVRYLRPGATSAGWDESALHQRSASHPRRTIPAGTEPVTTDRYELFWSLSFGVRRGTFLATVGGFDPQLDGYGGEDTDFAFAARRAGVPLAWLPGATAFHQHHETFDPPVQHLASIVRNATIFRDKWGTWPMEGWLRGFDELGLVRFDPDGDVLQLVRTPTADELAAARRDGR